MIGEDLWSSIENGPYCVDLIQAVGNVGTAEDMIAQGNKKKANDKCCHHELHRALLPVVYNYIRGWKIEKEI